MSRCFPFPPPGYEKKSKTDDRDVLTKEKNKEKKHKKDKKDKEKREHKEKKDKERSAEKRREEKDRKEKHKDKKDRDRDKEKKGTSDDKRIEGQSECYNGRKLGPLQSTATKDSQFLQELGRRIADKDGAGNQMVQKITVTDQTRAELPGRVVERNIGNWAKGKEKAKDKKENDTKANGQRNEVEAKDLDDAIIQSFFGMDQRRVEGMARPMEKKDVEKQVEGKEKNKHKESDVRGDKPKDRDREKKSKSKDKGRDKEKEKEKAKDKGEKNKVQARLKDGSKDSIDNQNMKPSHLSKEGSKSSASEGNLGKRKELEINGFLHDNNIQPSKLLRPVSSSHPVLENGRKLEPCQTAITSASERQGQADNHKVVTKEHKINGLIQAQQSNVCSTRSLSATVQGNKNGETSAKPPHPDSKYLSRILSVPKLEEWSDFDDQEWLFSSSSSYLQSKKPIVSSLRDQGTPQVWAEALQIESADVSVLPYVIPY